MPKIRLDHQEMDINKPTTAKDILKMAKLYRKGVIAARFNGNLIDLKAAIFEDGVLEPITFDSKDGKSIYWHSTAHLLAQAVKRIYGDKVKIAIGPSTEDGFYYDFDIDKPFTPEDLQVIEDEMQKIKQQGLPIERIEMKKEEAYRLFREMGEDYKLQILDEIEDDVVSCYKQGEFIDLCRGPHLEDTGKIGAFKLLSVAGAYWRGDENNKMLQRIYGISFPKKSMLDEYIKLREEARKRDHRVLGRELDLFSFDEHAPGIPFWHHKGTIIYNEIINYWREVHYRENYLEIKTPFILDEELWHKSGHWENYKENMYFTTIENRKFAIKPMNCPGGLLVYKKNMYSYRDLPLRVSEIGTVHRYEKSGVLSGLLRVRAFTQDDAHIFCEEDDLKSEIIGVIKLIFEIYKTFGFEDYTVELSTRPEKSIGSDEMWERAESSLKSALEELGIEYGINPGEGAFYGPKIDFHIKDVLNRYWQCGTIQVDFSMPERFDITYIGRDGKKHRPVMVHRAILGSIERFTAILIEHYGGAFPVWLSPVQIRLISVSDEFNAKVKEIYNIFRQAKIRVDMDITSDTVSYKVRKAIKEKLPYFGVIGKKEIQNNTISLRKRGEKRDIEMKIDDVISLIQKNIQTKEIF